LTALRRNRFLEQFFGTGFTHSLSPARHAGRVDGQIVFEILHSAQIRPIRISTQVETSSSLLTMMGVSEAMKQDPQSCNDAWAPLVRTKCLPEYFVHAIPADGSGQFNQAMTCVDHFCQFGAK
jgi:hypothetical protein